MPSARAPRPFSGVDALAIVGVLTVGDVLRT
jgi:hypothetical protein